MKLAFEIIHCYKKLTSSEQSFQTIGNWPGKKAMLQQMDGGGRVGKFKELPKEGKLVLSSQTSARIQPNVLKYISSESLHKEIY